jgi:glycosyltransferase involved in cell wall biosynthesis
MKESTPPQNDNPAGGINHDNKEASGLLREIGIAVIGNLNPPDSGVYYQAEVLIEAFKAEGARVRPMTYQQNRFLRPLSIAYELWSHRRQYDALCCQGFSFGNWVNAAASIIIGKILGKPISLVYRGGGFREFAARWPWAVLPFLRRVDALIVPSGYLEAEFRKHGLNPQIIPNVIELDDWPYRRRRTLKPQLLWIRHLRSGYNPWMGVEVLRLVRQVYPEAMLRIAGSGPMENEIRERIVREGIEGVELLGHLPLTRIQELYAMSDIFLNTTNTDNQPRSVLEAMASGLPVVSTNIGGLPFLIEDRVTGILVPPRDPQPMAGAVLEILQSPSLGLALADSAKRQLPFFSWRVSRYKWARVFAELGLATRRVQDDGAEHSEVETTR